MPTLPGDAITDLNNGGILDANTEALVETSIPIIVTTGGILTASGVGSGVGVIVDALALILTAVEAIDDYLEGDPYQLILDAIDEVALDTATLRMDTGYNYQLNDLAVDKLDQLLAYFPIDAEGGLTQEEHDHLLALVNSTLTAGDIWGYNFTLTDMMGVDSGPMAQTVLGDVWQYITATGGYEGLPVPERPHFRYLALSPTYAALWLGDWTTTTATTKVPVLDLSLVQDGDTLIAYLQREYPSYTWTQAGPASRPAGGRVYVVDSVNQAYFVCTLTDADIQALWPVTVEVPECPDVTVETTVAGGWPGLAKVTLGDPVTMSDGATIPGPLDGVLYHITTKPARAGQYAFGDLLSYKWVGALTFATDSGDYEMAQNLALQHGIITPRTMGRAASALMRLNSGFGGTVTPWTRNDVT